MVTREGYLHHVADFHLPILDNDGFLNSSHCQDAGIWGIDDGGKLIDAKHPQAQVNLVLAMLENNRPGVRPHVELAGQIMSLDKEIYQTVADNIEDGLERKPDWKNLQRVKAWLLT